MKRNFKNKIAFVLIEMIALIAAGWFIYVNCLFFGLSDLFTGYLCGGATLSIVCFFDELRRDLFK